MTAPPTSRVANRADACVERGWTSALLFPVDADRHSETADRQQQRVDCWAVYQNMCTLIHDMGSALLYDLWVVHCFMMVCSVMLCVVVYVFILN